ncbi:MAG: hypothetical protein KJ911_07865 [Alphaproteobacteria bacterium]|uniref:hypothetical protein n=1 Tax=Brevundimonas sp. TaxID=1871086 RepID=UPI0025C50535|nr:hypothetical protein [Brevundimonas sp.]MBU4196652.1 hypothetical protein [Alphaproteobacteria bacterium]MCG2662544.1 hypothetical protein [Brevundimonas sp.]
MARRVAPASASIKPKASLLRDSWSYTRMAQAMIVLAREIPLRTSLRQVLAFVLIAEKNSLGHEVIVADLAGLAGDDANGQPIFGQSINRSYQALLAPTDKEPDGLDWIVQEPHPSDARRKVLRLTQKGEAVARKLAAALNEKE